MQSDPMIHAWPCKDLIECTVDGLISYGIVQPGQYDGEGVPVVRVNNFDGGRLDTSDVLRVATSVEGNYKRTRLRGGEVLLTLVGSTGQTAIVSADLAGWNVARAVAVIRPSEEVSAKWINICLQSVETKRFLDERANTTVQKTINLADVKRIPIPMPPEPVRHGIESVITSIDDKIELNRRINQTLEALAQALFTSWFVDFDPVKAKIAAIEQGQDPLRAAMCAISGKTDAELDLMPSAHYDQLAETAALFPDEMQESELGEIPQRWGVVPAKALIEFNPKEPLRKGSFAPYLDMASLPTSGSWAEPPISREFGSGMRFRNGDALLARITPCLENGKSAFVQNLPNDTVGWGSTEFIVMRSIKPAPQEYAYLLARRADFREHAIRSMTGTSGRQRAQADSVAEFKVVMPSDNAVWHAFSKQVSASFSIIKSQSQAVETLAELRDTLLPKLLSGEISVADLAEALPA